MRHIPPGARAGGLAGHGGGRAAYTCLTLEPDRGEDRSRFRPGRHRRRDKGGLWRGRGGEPRSEEHTSELQSLMRISYAVFCLKKKKKPGERGQPWTRTRTRTKTKISLIYARTSAAVHTAQPGLTIAR